jgi:hypothetical protein
MIVLYFIQQASLKDPEAKPLLKNPKYVAGISYVLIGLVLRGFIDMLLPQSAAALLSAQSVVYTNILEYFFLDGAMDVNIVVGLVTTSSGIIFGSWGANTNDGVYSMSDLWHNFVHVETIIITGIIIGMLMGARQVLSFSAGGMQSFYGLLVTGLAAGVVAGWFGTALKCLLEIIKYSFLNGASVVSPTHLSIWILLLALAGLFSLKLRVVSFGLSNYHHIQFLPIYQVSRCAIDAPYNYGVLMC